MLEICVTAKTFACHDWTLSLTSVHIFKQHFLKYFLTLFHRKAPCKPEEVEIEDSSEETVDKERSETSPMSDFVKHLRIGIHS